MSALRAIANSILNLRQLRTSPAERYEAAGRFVAEALEIGAFAGNIELRTHVKMRVDQTSSDPRFSQFISAWAELVYWLRRGAGLATDRELEETFDEDCEIVARAILSEADTCEQRLDEAPAEPQTTTVVQDEIRSLSPVDPIPLAWLRDKVPQKTVKGDASKLALWLERRGVRVFKIVGRNHAERADLLRELRASSSAHEFIREYKADGE